ncbi:MAG: hypothetical protein M0P61_15265 [Ignavibacteriaceae bacterium]|nr:hypothetical protein [Ignavibacteriaceae bacterium]
MKVKSFFILGFAAITFSGCLVYQKVAYEISVDGKKSGEAKVSFFDLKSDALGNKEFNEDKDNLFNKLLKSDEFVFSQKEEGKEIIGRKLFVENKKLNGEVSFKFKDINVVEGIQQQDGYYFLTVEEGDSIISTNGTVVPLKKFKRIIWEGNEKVLKFEMLTDVNLDDLRELAPFYKSNSSNDQ